MAEEQVQEQTQEPTEKTENAPDEGASKEERGTKFVKFEDPEVEARFRRVYGSLKQYERVVEQMGNQNRTLLERLEKVEKSGEKREVDREIERLKEAKKTALREDPEKVVDIDDQIWKLRESAPKETPVKPAAAPQTAPNHELAADQMEILNEWASETNNDGNFVRPWAHPTHREHEKAAKIAADLLEEPGWNAKGLESILREVDKRMTRTRQEQTVLSGDSSAKPPSTKSKALTKDEKIIAKAMGVSEEQYLKSKHSLGMTA